MKILVYNLAAEYAGALTILENFYREVLDYPDKSIEWYFLVSTDKIQSKDNVTVISKPWTKKSWLHRSWFDNFCVQKVVKELGIDVVYSMQNMPVRRTKAKQVVYLHQSLQFSPVKFSLWSKEQRGYAIRQKFICNVYKKHLKHADKIIVQTEWMKKASKDWIPFDEDKIDVVNPVVEIDEKFLQREYSLTEPIFFYPAGDGQHKNHGLILEACEKLKAQGIENYKVIFTLDINTALYSKRMQAWIDEKQLPVTLTGIIKKEEVFDLYAKTVVLFPSYLETFGLPMLEAKRMKAICFASDMPFSHEILDGYENARFFDIHDADKLAELMKEIIEKKFEYKQVEKAEITGKKKTLIECILEE